MTLTFTDYDVQDTGVNLHFVCLDPGPGLPNDYYVFMLDTEYTGLTKSQLVALATNKLRRKIDATGIGSVLDPLLNQSITI